MKKIRVFIVDDHAMLRSGLRMLLAAQDDMEVVGEAGDFKSAISKLRNIEADVVTLDLSMPGGPGLAAIEKIRQAAPATRLVVLTMHDDPAYVRTALAMGAAGYVAKSAADTELISAIRAVHAGRVFVDVQSSLAAQPVTDAGPASTTPLERLSAREREVLGLIAQGHTNQAVADRLDLSVKTIESYRARLMEKLGLKDRADLTRFAIEQGLLRDASADSSTKPDSAH